MACDYFCNACKQLRLWLVNDGPPDRCRNCGSTDLEVDKVGSPRLEELRNAQRIGRMDGS
jgi:hypothetical protein